MPEECTTPGCPGDPHYASPGRGHVSECTYPLPWEPDPNDPERLPEQVDVWDDVPVEWRETEAMTEVMAPFMIIVLLFGAAIQGANRDERKALYEARLLLSRDKAPLPDVAQAIFDARGPAWVVPPETVAAIERLNSKET